MNEKITIRQRLASARPAFWLRTADGAGYRFDGGAVLAREGVICGLLSEADKKVIDFELIRRLNWKKGITTEVILGKPARPTPKSAREVNRKEPRR